MLQSHEVNKKFSIKKIFANRKATENITKLLSLGFGIILISWLISQLEWAATLEILRSVPISLLIIGFACYALSFFLRAVRFKVLLSNAKPVDHLFPIVLVHYTALNIIPARLGELSYVYLLKKVNNISTGYSVSSLLLARVFDQLAIASLFLVSVLFVDLPATWLKLVMFSAGAFLIGTFVLLLLILTYKEICAHWLKVFFDRFKWSKHSIVQRILHTVAEMVAALDTIQARQNVFKLLGLSFLIWISIFTVNYVLLHAFLVPFSYLEVVTTSTLIILLGLLPIQMLSGFGIRETTWVFIALAMKVSKNIAITSGFGCHILSTIFLVIFGVYGIVRLQGLMNHSAQKKTGETHPG